MILVFDLDDTLYDEITYVKSGLLHVAKYVNIHYQIEQNQAYKLMLQELNMNGRGEIFDVLLKKHFVYSKSAVRKCLSVYRLHNPQIKLNPDASACLDRFKDISKYIVTDGNKIVQRNKVKALGLFSLMKRVFITHDFGKKNAKPSTYCFEKIAALEKAKPENIIYIGDNPNKDFINLKKKRFKTIRIKNGMFSDLVMDNEHEAHATISTLDQLTINFIEKLYDSN